MSDDKHQLMLSIMSMDSRIEHLRAELRMYESKRRTAAIEFMAKYWEDDDA